MKVRIGNDIRLKILLPIIGVTESPSDPYYKITKQVKTGVVYDVEPVKLSSEVEISETKNYSILEIIDTFGPVFTAKNIGDTFDRDFILGYANDPIIFYTNALGTPNSIIEYTVLANSEYTETSYANILTARAFFVNTTLKEKLENDCKKKNRFVGRFPIEPFTDEFEPNQYSIHSTGFPKYRAFVYNQYNGFGVYPDWKNVFPIKDVNITKYESNVERTVDADTIIVTFPAEAQLYEGVYELIIVSQIYDEGYKNNVRTVTTNHKNVFELVSDSELADVDNVVRIEINNTSNNTPRQDIYVIGGSYSKGAIKLNRNDNSAIHVDVSPIDTWYEGD